MNSRIATDVNSPVAISIGALSSLSSIQGQFLLMWMEGEATNSRNFRRSCIVTKAASGIASKEGEGGTGWGHGQMVAEGYRGDSTRIGSQISIGEIVYLSSRLLVLSSAREREASAGQFGQGNGEASAERMGSSSAGLSILSSVLEREASNGLGRFGIAGEPGLEVWLPGLALPMPIARSYRNILWKRLKEERHIADCVQNALRYRKAAVDD